MTHFSTYFPLGRIQRICSQCPFRRSARHCPYEFMDTPYEIARTLTVFQRFIFRLLPVHFHSSRNLLVEQLQRKRKVILITFKNVKFQPRWHDIQNRPGTLELRSFFGRASDADGLRLACTRLTGARKCFSPTPTLWTNGLASHSHLVSAMK